MNQSPTNPNPELPAPLEALEGPAPARTDEPIVRLRGIRKRFGKLRVLNNLDLDCYPGEATVVLGPSGTGKSVMLKHIVGLLQPDSGEVWFGNQRVDQLSEPQLVPLRRRIGFLFQMGAMFDSMNIGQNIEFPLIEHTRFNKKERAEKVDRLLKMVGLAGTQKKMPGEMSGGQRKRAALARAIALEPELVLYDEPTTGLDPIRADVINELILALTQELGMTSIVVTHDMTSANKIADRMVLLYDGQVAADSDPESFRQSRNELVQRFIRGEADQRDIDLIRMGFAQESIAKASPAGDEFGLGKTGRRSRRNGESRPMSDAREPKQTS